jgi:Domain of unknown function (DUF4189)
MNKILAIIILQIFCSFCYASAAIYISKIDREHFTVKNKNSSVEAEERAKYHCIKNAGEEKAHKCELIGKTEYGGYGSIAGSKKAQGYALGKSTQAKADKIALQACTRISEQYKCEIVHQWQDKVGESSDGTVEENKFFVRVSPLFYLEAEFRIRDLRPEEFLE